MKPNQNRVRPHNRRKTGTTQVPVQACDPIESARSQLSPKLQKCTAGLTRDDLIEMRDILAQNVSELNQLLNSTQPRECPTSWQVEVDRQFIDPTILDDCIRLTPSEKRELAGIWEKWARQLRLSADFLEGRFFSLQLGAQ